MASQGDTVVAAAVATDVVAGHGERDQCKAGKRGLIYAFRLEASKVSAVIFS